MKSGVIVRDQNRAGELHEDAATGNALANLRPTVLLANGRTGSVAEVFAAALDEYEAAYVIGENTNGCVGYTDVQDLGDGTSLAVTTNVNLGPVTGALLNGIGVAPDELVRRTTDDIDVRVDVGAPDEVIVETAEESGADLLVIGLVGSDSSGPGPGATPQRPAPTSIST